MGDFDGERKDLPNATAALVLGALSLVFCWCYGIIGLVLGILAVVLASAPRKAYLENPERFTEVSYKNLNAGRICGIIGICIGAAHPAGGYSCRHFCCICFGKTPFAQHDKCMN